MPIPFDDPYSWFDSWFDDALALELAHPNAVSLATVSPDGQPMARQVLLKDHAPSGFVFYTNYSSQKGRHLAETPRAGLNFYWEALDRQIRIEGSVERLSKESSDAYFASRDRGSQIGAWASDQSSAIDSRDTLEARVEHFQQTFAGEEVPRPDHWGGYRVVPLRYEFWIAGDDRLHDRWAFTRDTADDDWQRQRLAP
jgi:pyridoxamine 5'-phosphate oxidase